MDHSSDDDIEDSFYNSFYDSEYVDTSITEHLRDLCYQKNWASVSVILSKM